MRGSQTLPCIEIKFRTRLLRGKSTPKKKKKSAARPAALYPRLPHFGISPPHAPCGPKLQDMLHSHHLLSRFYPFHPSRHHPQPPHSPPLFCLRPAPASRTAVRAAGPRRWLAELPETAAPPLEGVDDGGGPVELPPSSTSTLFSVDDNPSPLQTATSVLLTGAIAVFLYRSLRRRAKRAKELVPLSLLLFSLCACVCLIPLLSWWYLLGGLESEVDRDEEDEGS